MSLWTPHIWVPKSPPPGSLAHAMWTRPEGLGGCPPRWQREKFWAMPQGLSNRAPVRRYHAPPPAAAAGSTAHAASFSGTNYLSIATGSAPNITSGSPVCFWIYFPVLPTSQTYLLGKYNLGDSTSTVEWWFEYNTTFGFRARSGNVTGYQGCTIGSISAATWAHFGAKFNLANFGAYLNGSLVNTTTSGSGALNTAQNPLVVGGVDGTTAGIAFYVDALGIWNGSVNPISSVYNSGAGKNYPGLSAGDLTSLAAWYDFDESTAGAAATDASGGGYILADTGTVARVTGKV